MPKPVLVAVILAVLIPAVVFGAIYLSNTLFLHYPIAQGATVYQGTVAVGVPYPTGVMTLPSNGTTIVAGASYKTGIILNATVDFANPVEITVEAAHKCSGATTCAVNYSTAWALPNDIVWLQAYNGTAFVTVPLTYNATTQSWQGAIYLTHLSKGMTTISILVIISPSVAQGSFDMTFGLGQTPIGAPSRNYLW